MRAKTRTSSMKSLFFYNLKWPKWSLMKRFRNEKNLFNLGKLKPMSLLLKWFELKVYVSTFFFFLKTVQFRRVMESWSAKSASQLTRISAKTESSSKATSSSVRAAVDKGATKRTLERADNRRKYTLHRRDTKKPWLKKRARPQSIDLSWMGAWNSILNLDPFIDCY